MAELTVSLDLASSLLQELSDLQGHLQTFQRGVEVPPLPPKLATFQQRLLQFCDEGPSPDKGTTTLLSPPQVDGLPQPQTSADTASATLDGQPTLCEYSVSPSKTR